MPFGLGFRVVRSVSLLLILFLAYTTAILVAVWRCAEYEAAPWGIIARAVTVAWALRVPEGLVAVRV